MSAWEDIQNTQRKAAKLLVDQASEVIALRAQTEADAATIADLRAALRKPVEWIRGNYSPIYEVLKFWPGFGHWQTLYPIQDPNHPWQRSPGKRYVPEDPQPLQVWLDKATIILQDTGPSSTERDKG